MQSDRQAMSLMLLPQAETLAEPWVAPWEGGVWNPLFFLCVGLFLLTNWLIQREESGQQRQQ